MAQLKNLFGKALYIVTILGLPTLGYLSLQKQTPTPEKLVEFGLYYFLMLNIIFPGLPNPILLGQRKPIDYELVKLARIDEKRFFLIQILKYILNTSLVMTLMLLLANVFLPIGQLNVWLLGLSHVSARLIFEAISLFLYERYGFDHQQNPGRTFVSLMIPATLTYSLPLMIKDLSFARVILNPVFVIILFALGIIGLSYLIRSKAYIELSNDKINLLDIRQRMAQAGEARVAGGKVKAEDMIVEIPHERLDGLTSYEYLHQVFFERYRRTFERAMSLRMAGFLIAFTVALTAGFIFNEVIKQHFGKISSSIIQTSFYFFYFIGAYGERFTKVLFYNMDYHLLPYSFFREPEAVTRHMKIRFRKLLEISFRPTLLLCALFTAWAVLFAGLSYWKEMLLVNAVFIVLTLFFNLHHLIIYHTFQPYNRNMEVKSPITVGINMIIYAITFTLWRTNNLPTFVYLIVLGGMIIYVIVMIQVMKRLAPKNFKMKT